MDEGPSPAKDAGAARIIVGTDLINVRTDPYVTVTPSGSTVMRSLFWRSCSGVGGEYVTGKM